MTCEIPKELRGRVRAISLVLLPQCEEPVFDGRCVAIGHLAILSWEESNDDWLVIAELEDEPSGEEGQ